MSVRAYKKIYKFIDGKLWKSSEDKPSFNLWHITHEENRFLLSIGFFDTLNLDSVGDTEIIKIDFEDAITEMSVKDRNEVKALIDIIREDLNNDEYVEYEVF